MPEWRGKGMRGEQAGFDDYFLWHAEHTEDKGSRYANPTILDNGKFLENTEGQYGPDLYVDHINAFMEQHRDEPFFVYYPMALTHGPFNPTPNSPEWESGDRLQNDPRFFKDMVEYMDIAVGRVVKKLDELGLRERTLILYYGDNGSPREVESQMGEQVVAGGKGYMTDAGTRVPLIANWQGVCPPGRVTDDLVDSTDFIPTMIEATGAEPLDGMVLDGQSFLPQVRGETGKPREWALVDHNPHPGWDKERFRHERFARDQRFKLYGDGRLFDISNDVLEEKEIPAGEASPEAQAAREKLQTVLDRMRK
jgi:arylsulfatase A-like enzyme